MHSKRRNTKLPKNFILKHFSWILTRDQFGQTEQFVETLWKNMKMLWPIVYLHFPLTRKILRRVFKSIKSRSHWQVLTGCELNLYNRYILYYIAFMIQPISLLIWKPDQDNRTERKCPFGIGPIWWSQRLLRIFTWTRRNICWELLEETCGSSGKRLIFVFYWFSFIEK